MILIPFWARGRATGYGILLTTCVKNKVSRETVTRNPITFVVRIGDVAQDERRLLVFGYMGSYSNNNNGKIESSLFLHGV